MGAMQKAGLDTKDIQAKIEAMEIKSAKTPQNANSETIKRKLRNAENRANQLAQNVQKTNQLLESQKNSLVDAEEEVLRLTEEHKHALKMEGFEQAAVPAVLLTIPVHLEGQSRDQYKAKLDELQAVQTRFQQEAAAITGNLQAFANIPKTEDKDEKMQEDSPGMDKQPGEKGDKKEKTEPPPIKGTNRKCQKSQGSQKGRSFASCNKPSGNIQ